jgi:hypothetical protein
VQRAARPFHVPRPVTTTTRASREAERGRSEALARRHGRPAELDARGRDVRCPAPPPWWWHALAHHPGPGWASGGGWPQDAVLLQRQAL